MRWFLPVFLVVTSLLLGNDPSPVPPQLPEMTTEAPSAMTGSYESAFIKMILALVGLILLFVISIWMLRRIGKFRFGGRGHSQVIRVVERCSISPKTVLFLVEIENKKVLIAESQLEVRRLETLEGITEE